MKQIKIPAITAILSAAIFYVEINSIFSIGSIINSYFTCKQEPMNSFPCYGIYDIYFMLLLAGIFISSLVIIGIRLYKTKKNRNIA
jgi:hypothetical protein